MLDAYTGTPGSGKSLNLARKMMMNLRYGKRTVMANFPVNMDVVTNNGRRNTGEFIYLPNHEITVKYLIDYAKKHHKAGVEGQTLLIVDEAGIMFGDNYFGREDKLKWLEFLSRHRHYGYDIILCCQHDRMLSRQFRYQIEYMHVHRKANNHKWQGFILTLLGLKLFVVVKYWYAVRIREESEVFFFRKIYGRLYDTMMLFDGDDHGKRVGESDEGTPAANGDAERSEEGPHELTAVPDERPVEAPSVKPPQKSKRKYRRRWL